MPLPCKILCRAPSSVSAVQHFFAVRLFVSLPCGLLCRALFLGFSVLHSFAVNLPNLARQRRRCRAAAHGKGRLHGSACFSRSVSFMNDMYHKYVIWF